MKTVSLCLTGISFILASGMVSCASKVKVSDLEYPQTRAMAPMKRSAVRPAPAAGRPPVPPLVRRPPMAPVPETQSGTTGTTSPLGASSSGRSR